MLLLIVATGFVLAQEDGCSKDTDCKGERICENGRCVEPPTPRPPPPAEPPVAVEPTVPPRTTPPPQSSQLVTPSEPQHRHRGLFLRPDIGVGYINASASQPGASATISGGAGSFGFALGGSLADGLILAGHVWGVGAVNPSITVNGQSGTSTNTNVSVVAVGPELDYYVMPVNIFFSLSVAASRWRLTTNGNDFNTEVGIAGHAAIGKEWWVSEKWGLGLKGEFTITSTRTTQPQTHRLGRATRSA